MTISIYRYFMARRDEMNVLRQIEHSAWQKALLINEQVKNGKFEDKRREELKQECLYYVLKAKEYEKGIEEIREELSKYTASQ